jgi:hypothetical protein
MKKPIPIFTSLQNRTFPHRPFSFGWCYAVCAYPYTICRDLYTFYHRARYGWSPRDTWNLNTYLDGVLAETLDHLADHAHGSPGGYPFKKNPPLDANGVSITDHEQWVHDLKRWSAVFRECEACDDFDVVKSSTGWHQRETHSERRARVLLELSVWWNHLWD